MKGQDLVLLYKLVSLEQQGFDPDVDDRVDVDDPEPALPESRRGRSSPFSVRSLAKMTGIGKTEVANSLVRSQASGLITLSRATSLPRVNLRALEEFSLHGLRYVFPVSPGRLCRGMHTGLTAPLFGNTLLSGGTTPPVWADPAGSVMGMEIAPLFPSVPSAAVQDEQLYRYLALLDSLRMGQARELKLAAEALVRMLRGGQ